jgi:hypothetical protein
LGQYFEIWEHISSPVFTTTKSIRHSISSSQRYVLHKASVIYSLNLKKSLVCRFSSDSYPPWHLPDSDSRLHLQQYS